MSAFHNCLGLALNEIDPMNCVAPYPNFLGPTPIVHTYTNLLRHKKASQKLGVGCKQSA